MEALERAEGIRDVAVFGDGLHVTVEHPDAAIKQVQDILGQRGIRIERLESIEPSMEDVFVAMIEQEERKSS
jgi:ABC-2 type transport system ATP-binding protein